MQITVRPIEPKDLGQAVDVIVERLSAEISRSEEQRKNDRLVRYDDLKDLDKFFVFYVAEAGGKVVGTGGLQFMTHECADPHHPHTRLEMREWFTHPQYRGHHIGMRIYNRLLEDAIRTGEEFLYTASAPFPKTIELYRRLGFEDYAAPWFDGINPVMRKRIKK